MKKILLINPRSIDFQYNRKNTNNFPFALLALGTALKEKGYEPCLIDTLVEEHYLEEIRNNLEDCLYIGISVMTAQVPDALKITDYIKKINNDIPIVWGGIHVTLFPEQVLKYRNIDYIVMGEGEETAIEIAMMCEGKMDKKQINNLGYKESGKIFINPLRSLISMENYPMFNYKLLKNITVYFNPTELYVRTDKSNRQTQIAIHSARGCPYSCTFCINTTSKKMYKGLGKPYRPRQIEKIIEEILFFNKNYNIKYFGIQDEDFFLVKKRVIEFINKLKELKIDIKWSANARINYYNDRYINDKFMKELKAVGCYRLNAACESGSEKILKLLKKEIKMKDILYCAKLQGKYEMNSAFGFMIGLPGESKEDMYKSLKLAIQINKYIYKNSYYVGPQLFRPYPGTELYAIALKSGLRVPEKLEGWADVIEGNFGFMLPENLTWLNKKLIRDIIFIQRYFTFALNQRWAGYKRMPFPVLPLFFLLQFSRSVRQKLNWYSFFYIEKVLVITAELIRKIIENKFKIKIKKK